MMYRNIICFSSFLFITQNVRRVRIGESWRWLSCTHSGWGTNLQWISYFFFSVRSKFFWLYIIPDAHANSRCHASSRVPPTYCPLTRFLQAAHSRSLRGISTENNCIPFFVGTRCIFCYFRSTRGWLLPLSQQMSKGSSSQYLTIIPKYIRFDCIRFRLK